MNRNGTNIPFKLSKETEDTGASAQDDDAGFVLSSQGGDLQAFERLVIKHQKRMLNIAYRIVGDYDDACEVVQDAFVAAYKNIRTFRGQSRFSTWLTSIIVNLSKNRLKQARSRSGREVFSLDDPIRTDDGEMTVDLPSKDMSVLDQMEKQDVQSRVQECVKILDSDFREVLVLRDLQEFSYEEIGKILKVREGTVKSRLFRAREMVKECLKKTMGELF